MFVRKRGVLKMKNKILERAKMHANVLLNNDITLRELSILTGWSLSTVERDIHRLKNIEPVIYEIATKKLSINKQNGCSKGAKITNNKRWGWNNEDFLFNFNHNYYSTCYIFG